MFFPVARNTDGHRKGQATPTSGHRLEKPKWSIYLKANKSKWQGKLATLR